MVTYVWFPFIIICAVRDLHIISCYCKNKLRDALLDTAMRFLFSSFAFASSSLVSRLDLSSGVSSFSFLSFFFFFPFDDPDELDLFFPFSPSTSFCWCSSLPSSSSLHSSPKRQNKKGQVGSKKWKVQNHHECYYVHVGSPHGSSLVEEESLSSSPSEVAEDWELVSLEDLRFFDFFFPLDFFRFFPSLSVAENMVDTQVSSSSSCASTSQIKNCSSSSGTGLIVYAI